ncbi:MAG: hypothetical protein WBA22_10510 [Candidatus Methanofastidiosia archaeon]
MPKREDILWDSVRSHWFKFCGISDEYSMLRNKWMYFFDEFYPVFPDMGETFDNLAKKCKYLEELFGDFGFKREKPEEKENMMNGDLEKLTEIEDVLFDLSKYIALLKLAFFQRTVSVEIPHTSIDLPHNAEREIGNELIFVAADKIANAYEKCLRIPYWNWDHIITFLPHYESSFFFGAVIQFMPELGAFHISMSEEQKYFIGTYLHLAHELGHAAAWKPSTLSSLTREPTVWYKAFSEFCVNHMTEDLQDFITLECARHCPVGINEESLHTILASTFEQFICDLVAYKIGGRNTFFALLDDIGFYLNFNLLMQGIIRCIGVMIYERECKKDIDHLISLNERIEGIFSEIEGKEYTCIPNCGKKHIFGEKCRKCWKRIGTLFGKTVREFEIMLVERADKRLLRKFFEDSSFSQRKRIIDSLKNKEDSSILLSRLIEEGMEFKVEEQDEDEIKEKLVSGVLCPEDDPRLILHCYYEAFKETKADRRPSYAATIHSLAFNEKK